MQSLKREIFFRSIRCFIGQDPQSFRPSLYVSGLLPTRFQKLFDAKERVDRHVWMTEPSPKEFTNARFSFGCLRSVFPSAHRGSTFDDDFMEATRAALELRRCPARRLLHVGMRWVQDDYVADRNRLKWRSRLADLFRSLMFFEVLTDSNTNTRGITPMQVDFGSSEQSERVRNVLRQAPGKLRSDAAAQVSC
jgi:hypothetical protein